MINVFIDESGNDGARYDNLNQPFFTMVGIGAKEEIQPCIVEEFEKAIKKHRIQSSEIHAKNLRAHILDRLAMDVFSMIQEHHMYIFSSICQKRYVVASHVESDFLDPVYNDLTDNSYTFPHGKSGRADTIFDSLRDETFFA